MGIRITMGTLEVLSTDYVHAETTRARGEIRKVVHDYIFAEYKSVNARVQFMKYFEDAVKRRKYLKETKTK
jgi:hypothetical protein